MTTLYNSFEEGVSGVTITTGNSGGAPNNAFDSVTVGTGATVAYDNTHSAHGTLAAKIQTTGTASLATFKWQGSLGTPTTAWARAYFYFTGNPGSQTRVINFSNAGGSCGTANINGTGKIVGSSGTAGTTQFTFTNAIPLNTWFRIEIMLTGDSSAGVLSISLYTGDSTVPIETHTASAINTNGPPNQVQFGAAVTGIANIGPYWIDDVGASDVGPLGPAFTAPIPPQPGTFVAPRRYPSRAFIATAASYGNQPLAVPGSHGPAGGVYVGRRHWSFATVGTPVADNYFVLTTANSRVPSWSDTFYVYYNGNVVAGPFQIDHFGFPFAGFVNVFFTPAGNWPLNTGFQVIEGGILDQANPQLFLPAPRNQRQISRAVVGGVSSAGTDTRTTSGGYVVRYEGGQVAGGLPSYQPNILRPGINGKTMPWPCVPVPRRKHALAWCGNSTGAWFGVQGPQPPPAVPVAGTLQPRGSVPLPRRRTARAVISKAIAAFPPPIGTTQPRAAVPVPRRRTARAVTGNDLAYVNLANQLGPAGTVQSQSTVMLPRRRTARAVTGHVTSQAFYNGSVQPRATVPLPRRYPSRARVSSVTAPFPPPRGQVQPRATIPVPRRSHTRAWLQYLEAPFRYALAETGGITRRRTAARIVSQSAIGTANQHGPNGTTQPRATVSLPRRRAARAVTASLASFLALPVSPAGSVQPRATVRIPRRYPSRAWTQDIENVSYPLGTVQPRATVAVPRRKASRGQSQSFLGTQNASGPNGTVQARATVPVPRRTRVRAFLQHYLATANASGPSGTGQPRATVPIPRRRASRAVTASIPGSPGYPQGSLQPRATVPVPRRRASRAVQGHFYGIAYPNGVMQPRATVPLPRRYPARAVTRSAYGTVAVPGSIQPRTTVPVPRRAFTRIYWRGNAVPAVFGKAVTGGITGKRGRYPSRGIGHGFAGTPPAVPKGISGGIVRRRATYRCVTAHVYGTLTPATPNGSQPGGIVRRRRPYAAICGPRMYGAGYRGRPGPSVSVYFTVGKCQPKWDEPKVQLRWSTYAPMSGWQEPGSLRGTAGPGG